MNCPQCKTEAHNITPLREMEKSLAVFACSQCGFAFKTDGRAFVENTHELFDIFRGGSLAKRTLLELMGGDKLTPATKALFTARIMEYGLQMWNDGLKQGLILGARQDEYEQVRSKRGDPTPGATG